MARNDMQAILGALLGGAVAGGIRPRRRRRAPAPLIDVRLGGSRAAARALATLAGAVLGSMLGGSEGARPEPSEGGGRVPPSAPPPPAAGPLPNPWSSPSRPPPPRPAAATVKAEDAEALLILRAMISCAKADGALDAAERAAIAEQLDKAGLDQPSRDLVLAEFAAPATVGEIARAAGDPVLAAEIYAAAFLAAGEVGPAERGWLEEFVRAAALDPRAASAIEKRLGAA